MKTTAKIKREEIMRKLEELAALEKAYGPQTNGEALEMYKKHKSEK